MDLGMALWGRVRAKSEFFGWLRVRVARRKRPDYFKMRLAAPWAFQLEEQLSCLNFVD